MCENLSQDGSQSVPDRTNVTVELLMILVRRQCYVTSEWSGGVEGWGVEGVL